MKPERPGSGSDALEQAFFVGVGEDFLDELRKRSGSEQRKEALRDVVQLQDEAFLDRLVALDVRPETAVALRIIPLVFVAWADGEVHDRERSALLAAAGERGVMARTVANRMLDVWLHRRPDPGLLTAWKKYMGRMWGRFTPDEQWQMRQALLASARQIAEAAGKFLGLTSGISAAERAVLEELEQTLS